MTTTVDEFNPLAALEAGLKAIQGKQGEIQTNLAYLEDEHPRLAWIDKIRKVFGDEVADQIHVTNLCELAIEAPLTRLSVEGFDDPTAQELFERNNLDVEQPDLYRYAMAAGENFVIVAEADEGSDVPFDIVIQNPADVHVEMGSLKRGDRVWAVKVWADDKVYRAQVWNKTTYWRYVAFVDPEKNPTPFTADSYEADPDSPEGPHGFDKVPVVPFKWKRSGQSRLKWLRPINDRVNMLEISKVVAGVFGASKQRVFFTSQSVEQDDVEASPDYAIVLEPGGGDTGQAEASVTEFTHTPLENYDGGIESEIRKFFMLAYLPRTLLVNLGAAPSGEALKTDDGAFTEMIRSHMRQYGASWRDVYDLFGIDTRPVWTDPVPRNEGDQITNVKTATDAGVPLEFALRQWAGFTDDEIREFRKAVAEAAVASEQAMADTARAMMQGRDPQEFAGSMDDDEAA